MLQGQGGIWVFFIPQRPAPGLTVSPGHWEGALIKVFLKDSPPDVLLLDMRGLDHVMSATKPKTKDADIKVLYWPRLGWGLLYSWSWSTALIGLELSSMTPKSKSGHFANLRREVISMPPQSTSRLCFEEPDTWWKVNSLPWASLPVSFKTTKNEQASPSSEGSEESSDWIFPLNSEVTVDRPSLHSSSWAKCFWLKRRSWKQLLEKGFSRAEVPACLPTALPLLTPPGHTRMRCQVKYKQSTDWIIIYSVLNLN